MSAETFPNDAWLDAECRRLIEFGRHVVHPLGGAAWLDDRGTPDLARPVHTWITSRMVHVHGLGALLGVEGAAEVAEGTLAGLRTTLRDDEHGGWFEAVGRDGVATSAVKSCYAHAFVMLAGSTGVVAGVPGAEDVLADATRVFERHFWDEDRGRVVDEWDRGWSEPAPYRGLNSTMHSLEAMLAVGDVTGDPVWHQRAARLAGLVVDLAGAHDGRLPEHFGPDWSVDLELNRDRPDDPFKPYGATVGHGLEWSRLLLHLEATLGGAAPAGLLETSRLLFERAVADGWHVDGSPGFVYTTDWSGRPVVRARMHWVAAEAIAAAAALHRRTGEEGYAQCHGSWWAYAAEHLLDLEQGSWHHELDPDNRPHASVWPGKPDLYHAVQATLLPRLPLTPSLASAVAVSDALRSPA
ncbi:mannose/cellobiose epimerase-like protein (N-acyl-D-glucosamine 2-epimerase family) [Nocardioides cavernae]|uniref:Mannose/cellobiose epimerase-like protein (N-acyl-D-glucosamine 2-epimerase family) n=1 Tax=Nocardioides cavernae TaxID=1921566 RepID=A0A7Y9H2X4_9ACTN|nr:AGE family epimerase/isomerase [Nocardioides cavernae]NYE36962.1 mannose/cellobiose epimerase-like protein (N-acyl-D-glucosamine 2-epimerase family) [Nocardioides cavernae]